MTNIPQTLPTPGIITGPQTTHIEPSSPSVPLQDGEERVLSTQEEAEAMMAEIRAHASPIRKAYMNKILEQKKTKQAIRKRQNNARTRARKSKKR